MQKLPRLRLLDVPQQDFLLAFFESALLLLDALASRLVSLKCELNIVLRWKHETQGAQ